MDSDSKDHYYIREKVEGDIRNMKQKNGSIEAKEDGTEAEQKLFKLEAIKVYLDDTFDIVGYSEVMQTNVAMKRAQTDRTPLPGQQRDRCRHGDQKQSGTSTTTFEQRAQKRMRNYYDITPEVPQRSMDTSPENYRKPEKGTQEYELAKEEYNRAYGEKYVRMDSDSKDHYYIREKVEGDIRNVRVKNRSIEAKENGTEAEQKLFKLEAIKVYLDDTFDVARYSEVMRERRQGYTEDDSNK
jgi:hypothetical protein